MSRKTIYAFGAILFIPFCKGHAPMMRIEEISLNDRHIMTPAQRQSLVV